MQTARRARLVFWMWMFTVGPWMLGHHSALCCQTVPAGSESLPPQLPEAQNPIELERPIVITTPGRRRLNRDLRARGTAFVIAAPNVTIDGNGHVVVYNTGGSADVNGVHLYVDGSWAAPDKQFGRISRGKQAINAKIENLVLLQAELDAPRNNGIGGFEASRLKVRNSIIKVGGEDSMTVHPIWGDVTLTNNVLIAEVRSTANRHHGPANVKAPLVVASGNVLIGGNSGVNACEAGSIVSNNVISHDSIATNGYGIWLHEPNSVVVRDNIILPTSGRGILLNGSSSSSGRRGHNNTLFGNVILAREQPNDEYADSLNATGVRIRYNSTNNKVTHNFVLAIGGGDYVGASGLYLSVTQPGATSRITDNTFSAILSSTPGLKHYAKGITLEGNLAAVDYQIDDNAIQSNHLLISMSGQDGSGQLRRPMIGNALTFIDGNAGVGNFKAAVTSKLTAIGMSNNRWAQMVVTQAFESLAPAAAVPLQPLHKTFYSGFYTGDEIITMLDTRGNIGLDLSDVFVEHAHWPGLRRIGIGTLSQVRAMRQGRPLAQRPVVCGANRDSSVELRTNAQGYVDLPVVQYFLARNGSSENEPYVRQEADATSVTLDGTTKNLAPNAISHVLEF